MLFWPERKKILAIVLYGKFSINFKFGPLQSARAFCFQSVYPQTITAFVCFKTPAHCHLRIGSDSSAGNIHILFEYYSLNTKVIWLK